MTRLKAIVALSRAMGAGHDAEDILRRAQFLHRCCMSLRGRS